MLSSPAFTCAVTAANCSSEKPAGVGKMAINLLLQLQDRRAVPDAQVIGG